MLRAAAAAVRRRISLAPGRQARALSHWGSEQPSGGPLYARLSAHLTSSPSASVTAELDRWLSERRPLSEEQLMESVRWYRKNSLYSHALQMMDWMEAHGVNLKDGQHALRLDIVSRLNGIQAAEEYFSNLPNIIGSGKQKKLWSGTEKMYSSLLNCYAEHRMADKGLELYLNMKAMNIVSNVRAYNSLMSLYLKTGQPEKIPTSFFEMQESGIQANSFSYCLLTESYFMMNDLESVEKVLKELQKVDFVSWSLYTTMANNYNKLQLFDKAELTLKKAEEVMDKRDILPWHYLLSLYANSGNLSEVKRIWESLKSAFEKCPNRSYLAVLFALKKLDDFDSLQKIFHEWESSHEHYDVRIPNVIIQAYLDKGMTDKAEVMRQTSMAQGYFNAKTFHMFIEFYLEKSKIDEALEVWRDAKNLVGKHNFVPRKELVNRFLKHFEDSKDADGMETFCRCLRKLDCLDAEAYEALIRTYISAGRTNPSIAQRITEDRVVIRPEMVYLLRAVSGETGKEGVP